MYYFKVSELVDSFHHLCGTPLADGTRLAWYGMVLPVSRAGECAEDLAERIGALMLSPEEARAEVEGRIHRALPVPTDPVILAALRERAETARPKLPEEEETAQEEIATE